MGCCLLAFVGSFFPRLALALMWIFTNYVDRAFSSFIWPLLGLIFLPFYLLSIWSGSFYGIVGVALGVTFARTAFGMVQFAIVARLVKQTLWQLVTPMAQPLLAACMLGVLVGLCRMGLGQFAIPAPAELAILTCIGGAAWVIILGKLFPILLEEALDVFDYFPKAMSVGVRRLLKPVMA